MSGVGTHQFRQDLISLLFAHRMRREAAPSRSCTVHHDTVTGRRASCCEQRVACRPEQPGEFVARLNRTLSHRAMRVFARWTRYTCPIAFASPRERPPRLLSVRDPDHCYSRIRSLLGTPHAALSLPYTAASPLLHQPQVLTPIAPPLPACRIT